MKIGVSACLIGKMCRYDGGHAKDKFVLNLLTNYFDMVAYCPEDKLFGSPRETIRLVNKNNKTHAVTSQTNKDITKELKAVSKEYTKQMQSEELCGFILKSKSPSCGLERVKLYNENNPMSENKGMGIFAQRIRKSFPYLPIEEEGRLNDAWIKENFLMQVFAYEAIHNLVKNNPSKKDLVQFHTQYKYLIYSKSTRSYKRLGNIVANHKKSCFSEVLREYKENFLKAIMQKSSIKKTYNVLQHIVGYFKKQLPKEEKVILHQSLEEFKKELIPLVVVIKLIEMYTIRYDIKYLKEQKFLNPYPKELALRSSVNSNR